MYENRFLCGVEGVIEVGRDDMAGLLGGVCDLVASCTLEVRDEPGAL